MARSVAAIALGCQQYDSDIKIDGVICNNVASETHARWVREAIEAINIPVLGCIPRTPEIALPKRHLGLHTAHEHDNQTELIQQIADVVTQHVDMERVLEVAKSAPILEVDTARLSKSSKYIARIAVARDLAFNFYYEDILDLLRQSGAEVVFFSPLDAEKLPPNITGLYIGGGYPELYAQQLSQNIPLLSQVRKLIKQGLPTYAECGGLMLLTEAFIDEQGQSYPLIGVIQGQTRMSERLTMSYREVTAQQDTILLHSGETMRGHEFHYSKWETENNNSAYQVAPRYTDAHTVDGYSKDNVLASYIHLHFASQPIVAQRFVEACHAWQLRLEEVST
jgi:cobyrinic acid a,c-diamide synthase